ncbi:MAG: HAD-IA family hydrolase [Candidatus Dadabacteria bacterium]|nr:HAD-IA family hydrolase [Candidatus Dadabacteria bacterium]NIQ13579.1 HAD-IA family hydrolase [Candidatus Dadabacteria bacterium]
MSKAITKDKFEAVLFDLDGVLTPTEKIHAACWKEMFDNFLRNYSKQNNTEFKEFEIESDYLKYVDGKPRYMGVKDFLESRNIDLEEGHPDAPSDEISICGLGNKKNELFNKKIKNEKVEVYNGSLMLVNVLKENGFKLAVVSSSKNCKKILSSAKLDKYFEIVVDGLVADHHGLKGKPDPETYMEACKLLSVSPIKSVVIEDAISGVQAGKNGNFGLVIGVARKNNENELIENGADIVVKDLGELI